MEPKQTKKILHKIKSQPTAWESNLCGKGLIDKTYKELTNSTSKEQTARSQRGQRMHVDLLSKTCVCQKKQETMLSIPNPQRNVHPNRARRRLTRVRMAAAERERWRAWGEKGTPGAAGGCRPVQPLTKTVWSLLKKIKIGLPHNPETPLPGIAPKKTNTDSEARVHPNFHSSTVYSRQDMEATQVSINRWTGKETVGGGVCVCITEYCKALKKNDILPSRIAW